MAQRDCRMTLNGRMWIKEPGVDQSLTGQLTLSWSHEDVGEDTFRAQVTQADPGDTCQ